MDMDMDMDSFSETPLSCIDDEEALRAKFGAVGVLAEKKVLTALDGFCRRFIALSPFLVLATSDEDGRSDASPRGDAPGFVMVLDDRTLLLPDRRGNNRLDSFSNVLSNANVGLLFFVPGVNETLRVNGRGKIIDDETLLAPMAVQNRIPTAGLLVTVEQIFFHCGKALMRSHLWDASTQIERSAFPTLGHIIAEQSKVIETPEADRLVEEGYRTRLY